MSEPVSVDCAQVDINALCEKMRVAAFWRHCSSPSRMCRHLSRRRGNRSRCCSRRGSPPSMAIDESGLAGIAYLPAASLEVQRQTVTARNDASIVR